MLRYEDGRVISNAWNIEQLRRFYPWVKFVASALYMTKHIIPKLFYPHELQKNGEIEILQTKSCDNLADLFTKSRPYSLFHKCVEGIGMRRLRDLQESGRESF
jgi:hypothetical protein